MAVINFPPTDPTDPNYSDYHQQNGYTWEWDGTAWRVSGRPQLVLPPATVVGSTAPSNPVNGQTWFNTVDYNTYMWVVNPDTGVTGWETVMRITTTYGTTAPASPSDGDIWHDSSNNRTKIYIVTGWFEINAQLAVQTTSAGMCYPNATMFYDGATGEFGLTTTVRDELAALRSELNALKAQVNP